jgi:hypothetical protein
MTERTAAYLLAAVCVFQTLRPSWAVKPHHWRSIDVQIGSLRVKARNDPGSICVPALQIWQKEPRRLRICINDGGCMTAWLDGASHAWQFSGDKI